MRNPIRVRGKRVRVLAGGFPAKVGSVRAAQDVAVAEEDGAPLNVELLPGQFHRAPAEGVEILARQQLVGHGHHVAKALGQVPLVLLDPFAFDQGTEKRAVHRKHFLKGVIRRALRDGGVVG